MVTNKQPLNMNGTDLSNNNVQVNGKVHKNGDVAKEKKELKRRKHRRRNSDPTQKKESRDSSMKRHSSVYDAQLRHRLSEKNSKFGENTDHFTDIFSPTIDHKLQIIIVGDRNVGKTCFLERFTDDIFHEEIKSTIGIDFRMKTIAVADRRIRLQIWDTAGQERFNSITTAYYRNAKGIVLMYDVTRPESYLNISKWLDLIQEYARRDVEIAIVGNKADLPDIKVNSSSARNFAEKQGYIFYETSVKESLNVDTVFVNLIYKILKQIPQPHERNPRVKRKNNVVDLDSKKLLSPRGSCCKSS